MPSDELETARTSFLHHLVDSDLGVLANQPLVSYWQSVEAEARTEEDLGRLDDWSRALAQDKDKIEALKVRAHSMASGQFGGEHGVALINHILTLLDAIEDRLNRRLAALKDRLGRWIFLAGPGVKKKPLEDDDASSKKDGKPKKSEEVKRSLIRRAQQERDKDKSKPTKIKAL